MRDTLLPPSSRARARLFLATLAVVTIAWLIWSARAELTPFLVGIVLALLFAPLVDAIAGQFPFRHDRPGWARGIAILIVYIAIILLIVGLALWVLPRLLTQATALTQSTPGLIDQARDTLEHSLRLYRDVVPPGLQQQIDRSVRSLTQRATNVGLDLALGIVAVLTGGLGSVLAYIVTPFWVFFILKDRDAGVRAFIGLFPPTLQDDARVLLEGASQTFGSFIRAQLLNAIIGGTVTALGLWFLGLPFSLILGVVAGFAYLIPVIGAMLGGIPALIVAVAAKPGLTVLWTFLFLFVAQNVRDYTIVPRLQGQAVHLHPAIILPLLVIAGHLAGFWGLLLVVPVAAVVRDIFVYIYHRVGRTDEPVVPSTTDTAVGQVRPRVEAPPADR